MEISPIQSPLPQARPVESDPVPTAVQAVELGIFLLMILPSLAMSFLAVRQGKLSFALVSIATILRDLGLLGLVLYFLWRNREPFAWIGWVFKKVYHESILGAALFLPMVYATSLLDKALLRIGVPAPSTPTPSFFNVASPGDAVLAVILVAVVAITEETIFRGYLIRRLDAVTGSKAAAVVLSSIIFSLGHGYEGTLGVLTVGAMGFAFALIYLWRGSLVAPIAMHFLQDLVSIVILPYMASS